EDVCNGFVLRGEDNLTVIFDAEPKVGKHSLGMTDNVTLYDGTDNGNLNIIATDGYYELISVTATEISGVIVAKHDGDSTVTGTFTATRCCLDDTGFNYVACTE